MLDRLFAGSLADAALREAKLSFEELEAQLAASKPTRQINKLVKPESGIGVIAEIKRASPSKGDLADIPNPAALARSYEEAGASAISVLTERHGFKGSLDDLALVREASKLPVLRKDFIATRYQILEAKAFGADLVLLIMAWLDDVAARELFEYAKSIGLGVLVETHDQDEVLRAARLEADLIGINARDLTSFETDRALFGRLANSLPAEVFKVAESAVRSEADVKNYWDAGADFVLVGEALVLGNPTELIGNFKRVTRA